VQRGEMGNTFHGWHRTCVEAGKDTTDTNRDQCCCQGLETQGQGQGLENWSSRILRDSDFPRGQHRE